MEVILSVGIVIVILVEGQKKKFIALIVDIKQKEEIIVSKICTKCGTSYPETEEYFYKQKLANGEYKLVSWCKDCFREDRKIYQRKNKNRYKEYHHEWHKDNCHSEREKKKKYRSENKQKVKQYFNRYQKENNDKFQKYNENRQHKNHQITKFEWQYCLEYFDYKCAYCGITENEAKVKYKQSLHKEHAMHNGENKLSNCIPACRKCNSTKHTKDYFDWYPQQEFYNEERMTKITTWLNNDYKKYKEGED